MENARTVITQVAKLIINRSVEVTADGFRSARAVREAGQGTMLITVEPTLIPTVYAVELDQGRKKMIHLSRDTKLTFHSRGRPLLYSYGTASSDERTLVFCCL